MLKEGATKFFTIIEVKLIDSTYNMFYPKDDSIKLSPKDYGAESIKQEKEKSGS
jgi:hypothetical protein